MPSPRTDTLDVFERVQPGDRVELTHEVKVGFRSWPSVTRGTVVRKDRRRHSLHFQRNFDDQVFSDMLVLRREDGELTTVTLDEFSQLRLLRSDEMEGDSPGSPDSPDSKTSDR